MKSEEGILIAGITPYFLERGALWFSEHSDAVRRQQRRDPWWRQNTVVIEADARVSFSPFVRRLADLGYVRMSHAERPGEFAVRGGIVDIFAINRERPVRIEFSGNRIQGITELPAPEGRPRPKIGKPSNPSEYERLWLGDLSPGDFVVHVDHGIGIFRGFETRNRKEYYELAYAPPRTGSIPDRLLVPRDQAPRIARYVGFETPTIHRLGGTAWETTKRRAREDARKFAAELMAIYRARAGATRQPYPTHPDAEQALESSFPYPLTQDQKRALDDIHRDLSRERPMDRLLAGDVGFGKTEVAIRAASRVAMSGKQVAVLVPTTILAGQHAATFRERLAALPLAIVELTRLTPSGIVTRAVTDIQTGRADIVIGTARILSKDIQWKELGLAIIDEEQRFGVRHKEHFKKLRSDTDLLSLSATPIPRTLSLAIAKLRDLSMIQLAPPGRLAAKTFVIPYSRRTVREAIRAELLRGGQVFYLWNRIETIEHARRAIEAAAPNARIAILHGRLPERDLTRAMRRFRDREIDILVATTIIENGLDFPNANTLVVANAARLGLAEAYQIRGRIGRGANQAYAFFLYPPRALSETAALRLDALREAEELGSGFKLALRDLEIRGAGNVLGKEQSGAMSRVGLNLYASLLGEALDELREDEEGR